VTVERKRSKRRVLTRPALRKGLAEAAGKAIGWWVRPLQTAIFAGVGGVVLACVWQMGPGTLLARHDLAAYTGRTTGRITASWLAVDFDPSSMGETGTEWHEASRARICEEVEYRSPDRPIPRRLAFCSQRLGLPESTSLALLDELAPGVPFGWPRDAAGSPVAQIRLSRAALDWLATKPVWSWHEMGLKPEIAAVRPPPKNELEAMMSAFDKPLDFLLTAWSRPPVTELPVAFVPGAPERALPAVVVKHGPKTSGNEWAMVVGGLIVGLAAWVAGISSLSEDPRVCWAAGVLGLVTLPWWGEHFPRAITSLSPATGEIVKEAYLDLTEIEGSVHAYAPDSAPGAHDQVLRWTLAGTSYADTLGTVPLAQPQPAPANPDAALAALVAKVDAHAAGLSDAEVIALLDRLWRDKEAQRRDVGIAFVSAARTCRLDPRRSEGARHAAVRFLDAWTTQPVEEIIRTDLGYAERLRLWRTLTRLPDTAIANSASWVVERGEGKSD
jgi:hypothetical protein